MNKVLISLLALASACMADTFIQTIPVGRLRQMGVPVPPLASDYIMLTSDAKDGQRYSVSVTYSPCRGCSVVTFDQTVTGNAIGIAAVVNVPDAQEVSIVGFSIRAIQ